MALLSTCVVVLDFVAKFKALRLTKTNVYLGAGGSGHAVWLFRFLSCCTSKGGLDWSVGFCGAALPQIRDGAKKESVKKSDPWEMLKVRHSK